MIVAFDTYYFDNKAKTVCIFFPSWEEEDNYEVIEETLEGIQDYQSGEFYKRELPCILSLYKKIPQGDVDTIIVDGYVYLDDNFKFGLGAHLYKTLGEKIAVIGVAKSNFSTLLQNKQELLRGKSLKPLFISAIGIDLEKATSFIKSMKGEYRIPTLLKTLDKLTKTEII